MDPEAFRAAGHRLVDQLTERLTAISGGKVTPGEMPSKIRAALNLDGALPEQGTDPARLLEETTRLVFEHSLFNGHPKFFGYITSSPAPIGMLGDFLAAAANPNMGAFILSPAATEIEVQTVRWIAELIGYPKTCGGLLVSGGNMGNMIAFLAALKATDAHARGRASGGSPRVYCSRETHTWVEKAMDLTGLGHDALRWIPVDPDLRMNLAALRSQMTSDRDRGDTPVIVIGSAGTVSTGAVDPLRAIAAVCREFGAWFHVDGAYGGLAAAVPEVPDDLHALAEADSIAVDPHKWLYAPLEAGCALVRDPEKLRATFSHRPPYYRFHDTKAEYEPMTNFVEFGLQNSRGFRALKVWLALRHAGAAGYRQMISDDMRLSRVLAEAVRQHPALELLTQSLSITTFRYVPPDLAPRAAEPEIAEHLNALNEGVLDAVQWGGELFLSNAVLEGRYALRACIVNFRTELADVEAVPGIVARVGETIDANIRSKAATR